MLKIKLNHPKQFVVPDKYLDGFLTDFYKCLFTVFSETMGPLEMVRASDFDPAQKSLRLVVIVSLAHWPVEAMRKIARVSVPIICWHDDHFWIDDEARVISDAVYERAQWIVHGSKSTYLDLWGRHEAKSVWLPLFAAPYFYQPFNSTPTYRCLLSGHCCPQLYPIRNQVRIARPSCVDVLDHPGYQVGDGQCVREQYARRLNSYFCCVTDSGRAYGACRYRITGQERVFDKPIDAHLEERMGQDRLSQFKTKGQVLLKYFEIPAAGSLLIADEACPEMVELGFRPGETFVPMDKTNVLDVIERCCSNPKAYDFIRYQGWLMAREHTLVGRTIQLKKLLRC